MQRRGAESLRGSLWAVPAAATAAALVLGAALAQVDVGADFPLAFQGTADDARDLLVDIANTMITVIALVLGLAVVALQMTSSQYSPRLLRNFLRDRTAQVALGVFVGTFAYCAAGFFTVGVARGARVEEYPRVAVTGAIALLFLSLALLVIFANHLAHSLQIDRIMQVVERNTLQVLRATGRLATVVPPATPRSATVVTGHRSGYVQTVDAAALAARAAAAGLVGVRLVPRVGDHVVAGTPLALVWTSDPDGPPVTVDIGPAVADTVRIGFERTAEQEVTLGLRQLVDAACKALSPAVNDPYTAVQSVEHMTVVLGELAAGPTGDRVVRDPTGRTAVVVPERTFPEQLALVVGLVRRYGAAEPTVVVALLRLLTTCAVLARDDPAYRDALDREGGLLRTAADGAGTADADLGEVHREHDALRRELSRRQVLSRED